jgi:hypothetical protein
MANMQTNASTTPTAVTSEAAGSIGLQVAGGDLLLRGRFSQWVPMVITNSPQNDGAQATAQILFDVTSNRSAPPVRGEHDLFSFKASEVEALAPHTYRLKGQLRADGRARTVEAVLQTPAAHTPFCVVTFPIDRERFPGLWATLEERVSRTGQDELRPFAWPRAPELASA